MTISQCLLTSDPPV